MPLHFSRDMAHLFQRGGDKTAQANDIHFFLAGGLQNFLCRDHDAKIDNIIVVAAEDHADDVLADVVNVALHGRQQDSGPGGPPAGFASVALHQRLEDGNGFLHYSGRLDDGTIFDERNAGHNPST